MYSVRLHSCFNEELHLRRVFPVQDTVSVDTNLPNSTRYVDYLIQMADNCLQIPLFTSLCKPQSTCLIVPLLRKST